MTATAVLLPVDQPLDLDATLDGGQCFRWRPEADGAWVGVLGADVVRLRPAENGVLVESSSSSTEETAGALRDYLRLDDDVPAIQHTLSADPQVADAIAAYPGLRLLRQDPWETLAGFIISQNSNSPRIDRTLEGIADALGPPLRLGKVTRHAFPSPQRLASATEEELRRLGCGYRAPYLKAAAEMVASGEVPVEALRGAPYAEAQRTLLSIPGVGEKVADCVMLFALDLLEAFPVDRWIRRAVQDSHASGTPFSYARAREWALERFGPLAGYANLYLFSRRRRAGRALHPHSTNAAGGKG